MDDLDARIIEELRKDARTPFSKIAKFLEIGTDTVFRRFKKLQAQGIVGNPTIILDSKMCGFEGLIDFLIKTKPGANTTKIQAQIANIENVFCTAKTLGDHDLYCSVFFRNFKNMTNIYEEIMKIDEIVTVETIIYVAQNWTIPLSPYFSPTISSPE